MRGSRTGELTPPRCRTASTLLVEAAAGKEPGRRTAGRGREGSAWAGRPFLVSLDFEPTVASLPFPVDHLRFPRLVTWLSEKGSPMILSLGCYGCERSAGALDKIIDVFQHLRSLSEGSTFPPGSPPSPMLLRWSTLGGLRAPTRCDREGVGTTAHLFCDVGENRARLGGWSSTPFPGLQGTQPSPVGPVRAPHPYVEYLTHRVTPSCVRLVVPPGHDEAAAGKEPGRRTAGRGREGSAWAGRPFLVSLDFEPTVASLPFPVDHLRFPTHPPNAGAGLDAEPKSPEGRTRARPSPASEGVPAGHAGLGRTLWCKGVPFFPHVGGLGFRSYGYPAILLSFRKRGQVFSLGSTPT